jgi:phosphate starvation-inducible PhoH-like protein
MAKQRVVRTKRSSKQIDTDMLAEHEYQAPRRKPTPLEAQTDNQKRYIAAIKSGVLTFGIGPAGTGKTYIAATLAAVALENKTIDRIVVTRPAIEAGESLGFLPGELEEKYEPFLAPFRDVLVERLGRCAVEAMLKGGRIEAAPLAYMRGRTFKDAFVILDEAQNCTRRQMKLFLTRIGANCRVVVDGDPLQTDLNDGQSGLEDAVERVGHIPSVRVVRFTRADVVRSGLVQEIVQAYETAIPELGRAAL